MTKVTEYTREECLPKLISPTGVQYAVFQRPDVQQYEVLAAIEKEDEDGKITIKPDHRAAVIVEGVFTTHARAEIAAIRALGFMWDKSDAAKLKSMRPAERVAMAKAEQASVAA